MFLHMFKLNLDNMMSAIARKTPAHSNTPTVDGQ
jgi:hypothetical protein